MALLLLPNGNAVSPHLIKALRRLDAARFVMLNEYGKLIDIDERDETTPEEKRAVSEAFMTAVVEVIKDGRRWTQPDWAAIREKALADLAARRQAKGPKPNAVA